MIAFFKRAFTRLASGLAKSSWPAWMLRRDRGPSSKRESGRRRIRPGLKALLIAAAVIIAGYTLAKGLAWLVPLPENALYRPSSTLVFDRDGTLLNAFIASDDMWRINTRLDSISSRLQSAVITYEDQYFYRHPGFNPVALARALLQNIRSGRIVSGGSTLTMQIARMMEPKQRSIHSKIIEILRAVQLELRYSKRELLEIYFNIAPYGGNIEGVGAAAQLYFGKEPSQLSLGEAAMLAALPNSPTVNRPDLNPAGALEARNTVLERLLSRGAITRKAYDGALAEEIPHGRRELPREAPHFCRDLHLSNPGVPRLYTTLDSGIQAAAEDILGLHLNQLSQKGITNGAVVILDNLSHEMLAMVGSGDFNDRLHDGEVNGTAALRSPGSALKPFIYALALDQGSISPAHYLEDVPTDFSGYAPENYDRTFSGVVSARTALERSLNVPAVALESELQGQGLYELLQRIGAAGLRPPDNYGLSMAIGGCEVNLVDLTTLYSSLACGGDFVRARRLAGEIGTAPVQLFSPGAAYIITDILTGLQRPDLPACWEFTTLPRVSWKTGTSYGHRDAWSVGYNPRYTVGVWIGNFSGAGARDLVGAEAAAPVLFEIMNSICRGELIPWFEQPPSVGVREVCSLSGELPGPNCPHLVEELYLPDSSPETVCTFHQEVQIDAETGYRLPQHYEGGRQTIPYDYIQWPPRVGSWLESMGQSVDRPPQLLPEWKEPLPGSPPVISSPSQNCSYRLREGIPAVYQRICLEASAAGDARKLYWFIDGVLLGAVTPGERLFYEPVAGNHHLVCQDDLGRTTEMELIIEP